MVLWKTWWAGIYQAEYCLGGNYIRQNFLDCNNLGGNFPGGSYRGWELSWVGIFRVGVALGGNRPGECYPGWQFSLVGVFRVGIVRGGIIQVGIFRVGVFLVPKVIAPKEKLLAVKGTLMQIWKSIHTFVFI